MQGGRASLAHCSPGLAERLQAQHWSSTVARLRSILPVDWVSGVLEWLRIGGVQCRHLARDDHQRSIKILFEVVQDTSVSAFLDWYFQVGGRALTFL